MTLSPTPARWTRPFALYRRRTGLDSLGNETARYDMSAPDATGEMDFQQPKSWNTAGRVGSGGAQVDETGERSGGILEGYLRSALAVAAFDRLQLDGALYEVRAIHIWPSHRKLMLQRVA
ncbi:MAG: hypothetical protein IJ751_03975 [Oscillospiraceae bacterium]|nr:hypothetical protein [Oscillospiraceae bacterium]